MEFYSSTTTPSPSFIYGILLIHYHTPLFIYVILLLHNYPTPSFIRGFHLSTTIPLHSSTGFCSSTTIGHIHLQDSINPQPPPSSFIHRILLIPHHSPSFIYGILFIHYHPLLFIYGIELIHNPSPLIHLRDSIDLLPHPFPLIYLPSSTVPPSSLPSFHLWGFTDPHNSFCC